ncbi:tumor necrosis factor ligand superfamily member 14 [Xyrichtys novacula]|uniref:Tumor necrosis factor ligand superfamily member 14 n=1 Tax=Xyrichtys novacula TaxID=13765 RepID=A0AAV1GPV0_XYRNO|nr:tumor necrosis factor ligand superfamily member 14 [Xyrichtys novacula]
MTECGYPSVYVVDTHTTRPPPLPPRLKQKQDRSGTVQTLLFLLVSLALCGMVIEAVLIFRLHKTESSDSSGSHSKIIGDVIPAERRRDILPSKPLAHLTDGQDAVYKNQYLAWSNGDPLIHEMIYKDRSLIIQKEGYYYVYSKVTFTDISPFNHSVHVKTKRYKGKSIPLLASRKNPGIHTYSREELGNQKSNSFLGGVFHFYEDDAIFVKVSNSSQVVRHKPEENVFGAFML